MHKYCKPLAFGTENENIFKSGPNFDYQRWRHLLFISAATIMLTTLWTIFLLK